MKRTETASQYNTTLDISYLSSSGLSEDLISEISWLFPGFPWPNSIIFPTARPLCSEKRLRIPVSLSVGAASRSQLKDSF